MASASTTEISDEQMREYALQGIRADVDRRAAEVRQAMVRLKEALDTGVKGTYPSSRYRAPIENLTEALHGFDTAMQLAESMSAATYKETSGDT